MPLSYERICQQFRNNYIQVAKEIKHRSLYAPVNFHAVSCVAHRELCEEFKVEGVPHLVAFKSGTTQGTIFLRNVDNTIDVEQVADVLGIYLSPKSLSEHSGNVSGGDESKSTTMSRIDTTSANRNHDVHHLQRQQQLDYADAFLSLYYTLSTTIHREEGIPLDADRRLAFIEWMDLLYWTLPSYWDIHQLITDIRSNMRAVVVSSAYLKEILKRHAPPSTEWSHSCIHRSIATMHIKDDKGYICGLWKLFHIISVGVAEQHQRVLGDKSRTAMGHVAAIYHVFVTNFISNGEFQTNFVKLYDNCALNRCSRLDPNPLTSESWKQLSLWLWELHNEFKQRENKHPRIDSTESRAVVDMDNPWPSASVCPGCRNSDGLWFHDNVYAYLKDVYW